MEMKRTLINSIVNTAKDYEGIDFNYQHVETWLGQFPLEEHELILTELNNILSSSYLSKVNVIEYFDDLLDSDILFLEPIENYCFINPQEIGGSQRDFMKILDELMQKKHGVSIAECGQKNITSYIYVDDAIYSGNRVIRDIQKWSEKIDDLTSVNRLDIVVIAFHDRNFDYVLSKLEECLPHTTINIWYGMKFSNSLKNSHSYFEGYWPSEELEYSDSAIDYIEAIDDTRSESQKNKIPVLRETGKPKNDNFFTSLSNRRQVEKIFFEKGVQIVSYASNPNHNMRPMGYDYSKTLGFGSYLVTYRNIANNCPVVLWWGNPDSLSGINNWYPLFPRIIK